MMMRKTVNSSTDERVIGFIKFIFVPQVIDYIKLKAEVSELLKKRSDWERKIEIMELKKLSAAK